MDVHDQVELLGRLIEIGEIAMAPRVGVSVPPSTARELWSAVALASTKPAASSDERVLGDEHAMLAMALLKLTLYREDRDIHRIVRWEKIAGALMAWCKTDLAIHIARIAR